MFPTIKSAKVSYNIVDFQLFYAEENVQEHLITVVIFCHYPLISQGLNTNFVLKFRIGQIEIPPENAGAHNHPYTSMRRTFYVS
jgi:hypothetical protein